MNLSILSLLCLLLAIATLATTSLVSALSITQIPNGKNKVFVNGHFWRDISFPTWRGSSQSAGDSNQFMTDLSAASSWSSLCAMDSDNDGYTNGEELGDPSCTWTVGSTPSRTYDITHPGVWSSVPLKSTFSSKSQTPAASCPAPSSVVHTNKQERDALRSSVTVPPNLVLVDKPSELAVLPEAGVTDFSPYGGDANDIYAYDSAFCPHLQSGLKMWHDASTWGGSVPATGTDVTLPASSKVLIRACSIPFDGFKRITIPSGSELIIDDAAVHLRVKEIVVESGAKFLIGHAKCRVQNPVTITFTGEKSEISTYSNGIMGSDGSVVEMWGAEQGRTWSRLKTTAFAGADFFIVQDQVEWSVGDEVVVVTGIADDYNYNQNEVRRIVGADPDKRTFQLDRPLEYKHYAGPEYQIEVAVLNRAVIVRSDPDRPEYTYGGHILVAGSQSTLRVVGIHSDQMGQRNIMARYPFHMHMMFEDGGLRSCYIGNSVTNSHFRAYTVHGTNSTLVRFNTLFNTTGHSYYFEDGVEMNNFLMFNFGARVHVIGTPMAGVSQDGETVTANPDNIAGIDGTAGVFYLPNPQNTVVGNAGCGLVYFYDTSI